MTRLALHARHFLALDIPVVIATGNHRGLPLQRFFLGNSLVLIVPFGAIARSESSTRRSHPLTRVAQEDQGQSQGYPRTPEGITTSRLRALLAVTRVGAWR